MANWTTINSGGGSIAVPSAPNILATTSVAVLYSCPGKDSLYQLQASIAIDTGNTNIGHLKQIHVANSLSAQEVAVLLRPSGGWTTPVVVTSDPMAQTGADQPGTLTFICVNDISDQTAGAVTKNYTVQASKVNSITSQMEVAGSRVADVNRVVYFTASFVPVLNGNQVPQNVSYCFSADGTNWTYVGWTKILQVGQAVTISRPVPSAQQTTWKFAAKIGAVQWIGGTNYSTQNLTDNGFLIAGSPFTVNGLATPASNLVTGMSAGTISAKGPDPTTGWQWAEFSGINWTDPPVTAAGAEAWLVKYYVRETNISGTPAGDDKGTWREVDEFQIISPGGQARTSIGKPPLQITYRKPTDPYVAYHYLQVQIVVANRNSTKPTDWAGTDTANSVAQTGGFFQLDIGTLPTGKIPLNMADPATVLPGVQVSDVPAPAVGSMALSCPISNGATLASGQLTYCWDGTLTNLPTDPNYAGCEVTVQYAGSAEGGAFAKLTASQTTFHNGDWARPSSNLGVTFRAYPISRDGVRGTPAVYATTITAAASYTPPVIPAPSSTGFSLTCPISDGATLGSGVPTYCWNGTVTLPSDLTNYNGCEITVQFAGSNEGGAFAVLGPAQTTFHNGDYPKPASAIAVTFRAYPISPSRQRGTPATYSTTVPGVATYVPPVIPAPAAMTSVSFWIISGPPASGNVETYGWMGSIVRPSDLTNYNGCQLTQQWDGGAEGGTFQTLSASQTTFQSDLYYPRGSGQHTLVIRAYPISPSGIRGTPASFSSVVAAAATYVPPTGGGLVESQNFESGTMGDWTASGVGRFGVTSSSPISGSYSLQCNSGSGDVYFTRYVWCKEGAAFSAKCKYKSTAGANNMYMVVVFYDASWGIVGAWNQVALNPSTTVATVTMGPYTAPANTAAAMLLFQNSSGATGTWWLDDIEMYSTGGTGVILNPFSGNLSSSNLSPTASMLHDWDFNLSALGALPIAGPVWRTYGNVVVRDDGDGLLHYCRITDDSANGSGLVQIIPVTGNQQIKFWFRCRNNSSTAKLWVGLTWLNRNNPDPPWLNYWQSYFNGSEPVWQNSPLTVSAVSPAGTSYMAVRLEMIEGAPAGQYYDVGKLVAQLVPW